MLARAGELDEAETELQVLSRLPLEKADALELLGCISRIRGASQQALQIHLQARAEYEKNLPSDHPFMLRNTLYQEAARGTAAATPGRVAFVNAAERVKQQFEATSVWRTQIEDCERQSNCRLIL
jgi:hypothetical protein